ncbi:DUF2840 domain-containing protein [Sphingopyxis sp. DHUNG17]|nr:DUF2840 domain-containing protein [Sphingopyxis lutea]
MRQLPSSGLTDVELTWIEGRLERQLRFGRVAAQRSGGPQKRIASFRPGATFALLGCTVPDVGRASWNLAVVTAVAPGAPYQAHAGIAPGGDILLLIDAIEPIRAVSREIDMIEASGIDPCDVPPDHWRHIAASLAAALPFRAYGAERHAAWLRRRETE